MTTKAEPTPGEWRLEGDYIVAGVGRKARCVAKTLAEGARDLPTREANGNLMAAAPDMFRELTFARFVIRDFNPDHDLIADIDRALAKAKGER